MSLWGVMFKKLQLFVYELWPTKFSGLVALPESFPKISNFRVGDSPIFGKCGPKFKVSTPISPPPRGFGGQFRYGAMEGHWAYLSSKTGGPAPLPQFWGNFFPKFSDFQL